MYGVLGASNRRDITMREKRITVAELILIAGTRVALGMGVGLLIADKLSRDARRAAGWSLLSLAGFTTVPIALGVLRRRAFPEHT